MRRIQKGREPRTLEEHRATPGATWDGYGSKGDARDALCQEQGYLCAYCMSRIRSAADRMKIEHWDAQNAAPASQLDWHNLLGVCLGDTAARERDPLRRFHCDTRRGHLPPDRQALHVHPAQARPDADELFRYTGAGQITSKHAGAARDIETLNLNNLRLQRNRAAALDRLRESLPAGGAWTEGLLNQELRRWERPNEQGRLPEYSQVAVYHLRRWIRGRR